ncbi:MAG: TlpA disulfide reductase family protein [Nitrospiraceae bacterium]|nr:TlpA disulfide reductase family protein [Nitrospiraceae bacterium]
MEPIHRLRAQVILLIFCLAVTAGVAPAADKPVSPFELDKLATAPDFSVKDLSGKQFSSASLKGKVFLLNFWASWCPSCIAEMPSLNALAKDSALKSHGFEVVAVSVDGSASEAAAFLRDKRLDLFVLMDEKKAVTKKFKVFSLPTTFLINKNGKIVEKFFGEYDWSDREIRSKIEKLL